MIQNGKTFEGKDQVGVIPNLTAVLAAVAVVISLTARIEPASSADWKNHVDGCFSTGTNWTGGASPAVNAEIAVFNKNAERPYTVTFNEDMTGIGLTVGNDKVCFDLGGHTYGVQETIIGLPGGAPSELSLSNGTLSGLGVCDLTVGATEGSVGTLNVGAGATVSVSIYDTVAPSRSQLSRICIGDAGVGNLNITGGGSVEAKTNIYIGKSATGVGNVTVSGTGSTLISRRFHLGVMSSGASTLRVLDGATVKANCQFDMARKSGSNGSILIDGNGSSISVAGHFYFGTGGKGSMAVRNGGSFHAGYGFYMGGLDKGKGGTATLEVGVAGAGTVTVTKYAYLGGIHKGETGEAHVTIGREGLIDFRYYLRVWPKSSITVNGGRIKLGQHRHVGFDLRGTLKGNCCIEPSTLAFPSRFYRLYNTGTIRPGDGSAGTITLKGGELFLTNTKNDWGKTHSGTLEFQFDSSAHDSIILPDSSRFADLDRGNLAYSLLSGSDFKPLSSGFIDFLIAREITGTAGSDNMASLLASVAPGLTYAYGVEILGSDDYDGKYEGYSALRLGYVPEPGSTVGLICCVGGILAIVRRCRRKGVRK